MRNRSRARTGISYKRREPFREPKKCILIVAEGKQTERNYFEDLRKEWRLQTTEVKTVGEGATPSRVVKRAIDERDEKGEAAKSGRTVPFDEIWCVVDHDRHPDLERAKTAARKEDFKFILSVPCFEIWYLLHFRYSSKSFSCYSELRPELRRYVPGYTKKKDCFTLLLPMLNSALINAVKLRADNAETGRSNPATDVDLLVKNLQEMAAPSPS